MKISTSTKVIGALAIIGIVAAYGKKKYDDYSQVIEKLDFKINEISNVDIKGLVLSFKMSVIFYNPTEHDFYVNGLGFIAVKKIRVFRKGVFIGEANSDITKFEIPAFGTTEIKGIEIETKYLSFLSELSNLASLANLNDYKLEIVVEALGQVYVIEQPMTAQPFNQPTTNETPSES